MRARGWRARMAGLLAGLLARLLVGLVCAAAASTGQAGTAGSAAPGPTAPLRSDAAMCAALASADQTQQRLGAQFQRRWETLMAQASPKASAFDALERDAGAAQRRHPGVGLAVGAETFYHYIRYAALAPMAPADSASERALRMAGELFTDPAGQAVYFEPSTDVSGCMRPAAALPALRALAAAWPAVASCVKQQLGPKMVEAVDEMANAGCYCAGKTDTNAALKQIAPLRGVFASGSKAAAASAIDGGGGARRYSCQ